MIRRQGLPKPNSLFNFPKFLQKYQQLASKVFKRVLRNRFIRGGSGVGGVFIFIEENGLFGTIKVLDAESYDIPSFRVIDCVMKLCCFTGFGYQIHGFGC